MNAHGLMGFERGYDISCGSITMHTRVGVSGQAMACQGLGNEDCSDMVVKEMMKK